MPIFIGVIGNKTSGKSTVIRSLTGCPRSNYRDFVEDQVSQSSIYVCCGSPQEDPLGSTDQSSASNNELLELRNLLALVASTPGCRGIVMALQPSHPKKGKRLSIEDVFGEATKQGFVIYSYVLDPEHGGAIGTGNQVSSRLLPLGISPVFLDARRYAHINSSRINSATKVVT